MLECACYTTRQGYISMLYGFHCAHTLLPKAPPGGKPCNHYRHHRLLRKRGPPPGISARSTFRGMISAQDYCTGSIHLTIQLSLLTQLNIYNGITAYLKFATVDSLRQPVRANNKHYHSLLQTYWRGKLPELTTFTVLVYLTTLTKRTPQL